MASLEAQAAEVIRVALDGYRHPFVNVTASPGRGPDEVTMTINGVEFDVVVFTRGGNQDA